MNYKIILNTKEFDYYDGILQEAKREEFNIPYEYFEDVWYCYRKRKKYVVRESQIYGVWATNIVGVTLDNGWHIAESEFQRLFKDKNEAIDWCLKKNQREKVKVYRRR